MAGDFTHFDAKGAAIMVDVSAKDVTARMAVAAGSITMSGETLRAVQEGTAKKGDVLGTARLAGIMAAKKTPDLIPLCHSLALDTCTVDFSIDEPARRIEARCTVRLSGKTGAEMEALTGVSAALLTIYDMCKALDRTMVIGDIRLEEKSGGRSGHFRRDNPAGGGHAG
jgi:cyclic pyranopterin phosphate synthase